MHELGLVINYREGGLQNGEIRGKTNKARTPFSLSYYLAKYETMIKKIQDSSRIPMLINQQTRNKLKDILVKVWNL